MSSTVTGYLRRDELTGRVWDSTPLDCPERVLDTWATTLSVSAAAADDRAALDEAAKIPSDPADARADQQTGPESRSALSRPRFDAGVHALEHLITGVLPAFVANDRYDIGSHSWLDEDGGATIAVYDRLPGSGFAASAYGRAAVWLTAARDRIDDCPCANGCPACILTAGCGSSRPLDKATARRLLAGLLADTRSAQGAPGPADA